MATDLPKRNESRLPPIWVPLYCDELSTCSDCETETVHGCFVREADAKIEDISVAKYVPASELDAYESARKLAVEEAAEARHAADAMRERLEAALKRVGELELKATHALETHDHWCSCDIEELDNAMSQLSQTLYDTPEPIRAQTEKSDG